MVKYKKSIYITRNKMGKKHETKWLLGIAVVLLLGVVVIGSTTDYMGKFSVKKFDKTTTSTTTDFSKKPTGPLVSSTEEETVDVIMKLETDSSYYNKSYGDYEIIGEWLVRYQNGGSLCEYWRFKNLDYSSNGSGLQDLSTWFDDVHLYFASDDISLDDQIDAGEYYAPLNSTLSEFAPVPAELTNDTYIVYLFGDMKDDPGVDLSTYGDDMRQTYATFVCGYESDGTYRAWSENNSEGENEYFDMESVGTGYGVPGGVILEN